MDKACPACASRMIDGPDARGAWACTTCGGVWAGTSVTNRVVSILEPSVRELADVAARHAETTRSRAPGARDCARTCPDCRTPLAARQLGAVLVDVCAAHGTWFDRGELQRVADERLGRKPSTPHASATDDGPTSARWNPDRGADFAADVAVGALGLLFSILTDAD